jgi:7-carboxy-7-deazaguanine synthase
MNAPNRSGPDTLIVNEIFYSIQGESSFAGRPCVFVRLTYCNIRCSYCDTIYAFNEGRERRIAEIVQTVEGFHCPLVEITGGEPLVQPGVHTLMKDLCEKGYEVLLETGGTLDIGEVDRRVRRIVDLKCPSSGMEKKNLWENVAYLSPADEVKFVIGTREDYEWARSAVRQRGLAARVHVLFSPVYGQKEPATLAGWILADGLDVRLQIQLHKYVWGPDRRGV